MTRLYLPTSNQCVVCGQPELNHTTLNIRWYVEEEMVKTEFASSSMQMGYKGIVHGGVLASLLDEALCWVAGVHCHEYFITGRLEVKFLKPIPVGSHLSVAGRFHVFNGKYAECSGEVLAAEVGLCAEGKGQFFPISREQAAESADYWVFQPGDLDILSGETVGSEIPRG